jgi:alanine racemase
MTKYRTWLEIDNSAIRSNAKAVTANLPEKTIFLAMVKGNAWGIGSVGFARALIEAGATWIGATIIEDAIELRKAFPKIPILLLMELTADAIQEALDNDIRLILCNYEYADEVSRQAVEKGKTVKVHFKINTGLNRIGVNADEALPFIKYVANLPGLELEGICTHFACADMPDNPRTKQQLGSFLAVVEEASAAGVQFKYRHIANSPASINNPETYLDMVRPGMGLAGLYPSNAFRELVTLKCPITWKTTISLIRSVKANHPISYGDSRTFPIDSTIVIIPTGTADGFGKRFEGTGYVLIRGERHQVVGVTMDQTMIVLGADYPDLKIGEEVVLIGKQGELEQDPAVIQNQTGYQTEELCCQISYRVPRIYLN